jgi:phage-related protein
MEFGKENFEKQKQNLMYQLRIVKSALKEMEELPIKVNREIGKEIEALADNPRPNGCKKLKAEKNICGELELEIIELFIRLKM